MQTKGVWTVVAVCLALVAQGVSYEGVYKGGGMLRESQIVLLSTGKALMGDSPMAMMVGKWSEAEIATNKCVVLRLVGAVQGLKQVQSGSIAARIEDGKLSVVAMATGDADITEEAAKALSSQQDPLGEYTLMPNGLDGTKRQVYERLVKQAARQVSLVRRPERLEKMMAEIEKDPTWILGIKFTFPTREEKLMGRDMWAAYSDEMVAVVSAMALGREQFTEKLLVEFLSKCDDWEGGDAIILSVLQHKSISPETHSKFAPKVLSLVGKSDEGLLCRWLRRYDSFRCRGHRESPCLYRR